MSATRDLMQCTEIISERGLAYGDLSEYDCVPAAACCVKKSASTSCTKFFTSLRSVLRLEGHGAFQQARQWRLSAMSVVCVCAFVGPGGRAEVAAAIQGVGQHAAVGWSSRNSLANSTSS